MRCNKFEEGIFTHCAKCMCTAYFIARAHTDTYTRSPVAQFDKRRNPCKPCNARSQCASLLQFSRRISDSNEMLSTSCYYNDHFVKYHSRSCWMLLLLLLLLLFMHTRKKCMLAFNVNIHTIYECKSSIATSLLCTFVSFHFISFCFVFLHISSRFQCKMQSVGNWAKSCTQIHSLSSQWKTNLRAN